MSLDAMEVKQIKQENDGFDFDSDSEFFDASARQYYAYQQVKMKYAVRISYNRSFLHRFDVNIALKYWCNMGVSDKALGILLQNWIPEINSRTHK